MRWGGMNRCIQLALLPLFLSVLACGDDTEPTDDDDGGTSTPGDFRVFDCHYAYTCDDGSELSFPFESCTTQQTVDEVFLTGNIQQTCDDRCADAGATGATACALECGPTATVCECPAGAAECYP